MKQHLASFARRLLRPARAATSVGRCRRPSPRSRPAVKPGLTELERRETPGSLLDGLLAPLIGGAPADPIGQMALDFGESAFLGVSSPTDEVGPGVTTGSRIDWGPSGSPIASPAQAVAQEADEIDSRQTNATPESLPGSAISDSVWAAFGVAGGLVLNIGDGPANPLVRAPDDSVGASQPLVAVPTPPAPTPPQPAQGAGEARLPSGGPQQAAPVAGQPAESALQGLYVDLDPEFTPDNLAKLYAPPDQASREGQTVSYQMRLLYDTGGAAPTFSASGLPEGLSIDAQTGVISGTPSYATAQTNGGEHTVSVTATVGADTDTVSFKWWVSDTNRLSVLDDNFTQTDGMTNEVYTPFGWFNAYDELGNDLSLSVSGVPDGWLEVGNEFPGMYSGAIHATLPDTAATYTVTLTATGGGATDTRTFTWTNYASDAGEIVIPYVDHTLTNKDDFSPVGEAIPVGFLVKGGAATQGGTVTFSVEEGPAEIVGDTTVPLSSVGAHYVSTMVKPTDVTADPSGIKIKATYNYAGEPSRVLALADLSGIKLTIKSGENYEFTDRIRASTTPSGVERDRIPVRTMTKFKVTLEGGVKDLSSLQVVVGGESYDNGMVALISGSGTKLADGKTGLKMTGQTFEGTITGTLQTRPFDLQGFYHSKLTMSVRKLGGDGVAVKSTAGFSVASFPYKIRMYGLKANQGAAPQGGGDYFVLIGNQYLIEAISDSGVRDDLSAVSVSEKIFLTTATGWYDGNPPLTGSYLPAPLIQVDKVGPQAKLQASSAAEALNTYKQAAFALLDTGGKNTGTQVGNQYFTFIDDRTATTDAKVPYSGFKIDGSIIKTAANEAKTTNKKTPFANHDVQPGLISEDDQAEKTVTFTRP